MQDGTGFEDIEGIGPEKSSSVMEWYANDKNRSSLQALLKEVTIEQTEKAAPEGDSCKGITFVITGEVSHYKTGTN